jgi:hypothetical protein
VKEGVGGRRAGQPMLEGNRLRRKEEKNAWWAEEVSAQGNMEFFDFLIYFL